MSNTKKLLVLLLAFLAVGLVGGYWWVDITRPVSTTEEKEDFLIVKGAGASEIGEALYKQGLIRSSLAFKIYTQVTNKTKKIPAGEYRLSGSMSLVKIVSELEKGPIEIWVTIPEGLRREEIAQKYITELQIPSTSSFRQDFLSASDGQEGYLFPDTYIFPKDISAEKVVAKMISVFEKKAAGVTKEQLIMASLLERETKTDAERPIVAGILYKRLDSDWPLQVDASVQYIIATQKCKQDIDCTWWPTLSKADLEVASTYNTYKYRGLPPSPISNPGLSSIKAAVNPQTSPYWFYLHDADGVIHYGRDLEEHNRNIVNYLGKSTKN